MLSGLYVDFFFFFNDPASTEIYTLSLHDALPISRARGARALRALRSGHSRAPVERLRESRRACAAGDISRRGAQHRVAPGRHVTSSSRAGGPAAPRYTPGRRPARAGTSRRPSPSARDLDTTAPWNK